MGEGALLAQGASGAERDVGAHSEPCGSDADAACADADWFGFVHEDGAIERVRELLDGKGLRELGQRAVVLLGVEGSAVQAGGRGVLRAQRADERVRELYDREGLRQRQHAVDVLGFAGLAVPARGDQRCGLSLEGSRVRGLYERPRGERPFLVSGILVAPCAVAGKSAVFFFFSFGSRLLLRASSIAVAPSASSGAASARTRG